MNIFLWETAFWNDVRHVLICLITIEYVKSIPYVSIWINNYVVANYTTVDKQSLYSTEGVGSQATARRPVN